MTTEAKFNEGDLIECIRPDKDIRSGGALLKLGQRYTVLPKVEGWDDVRIGTSPDGWDSSRFKLVRPAMLSDSKEPEKAWVPVVGERVRLRAGCSGAGIPASQFGQLGTVEEGDTLRMDNGKVWGFGGWLQLLEPIPSPAAVEGGQGTKDPRAITDSDVACASVVDSTSGSPGLASREPGDAGSSPARRGTGETSPETAGAIPTAGAKRKLTFEELFLAGRSVFIPERFSSLETGLASERRASVARHPHEGRSDRVYLVNRRT